MQRILILGGTGEARSLAAALAEDPAIDTVSSLAGRVRDPRIPAGVVRIGGFGGEGGLAEWLQHNRVDAIVDATHPFAARMTENAAEAARRCRIPLVVLRRPEWTPTPGDDWRPARDLAAAAALLPDLGARIFLTVGRQGVGAFADLPALRFLVRAIDPPAVDLPARSTLLLARGPFTVSAEIALMQRHQIDVLVTKNSGGDQTAAKLHAARDLGIPVVMIDRPPLPRASATVGDVAGALDWIRSDR
ncbi:cobalt-precorrin-6A reductase [Rhodococcus tibetensis]|uniref:Cobalt-precorrin-6A reductase n=1 Tax=Rhodococcus tibetensis TaxID=2965064 RepID=A0ABT1QCQ7_9NOCA|nr:cobalt-precorrin-6A reductase [Rhodococcus sp. FXJ9.536]MCQ4120054.1 cobalt-precorrin-6A reductase [Rhodococcus sp. FXJ9.536]